MSGLTYAPRDVNPANTAKNNMNIKERWYQDGKTIFWKAKYKWKEKVTYMQKYAVLKIFN